MRVHGMTDYYPNTMSIFCHFTFQNFHSTMLLQEGIYQKHLHDPLECVFNLRNKKAKSYLYGKKWK